MELTIQYKYDFALRVPYLVKQKCSTGTVPVQGTSIAPVVSKASRLRREIASAQCAHFCTSYRRDGPVTASSYGIQLVSSENEQIKSLQRNKRTSVAGGGGREL